MPVSPAAPEAVHETRAAALEALLQEIRACRICAPALAHAPRPVVQAPAGARILVAGQAPGRRVHLSGQPFTDPSGVRLRGWMGVSEEAFYRSGAIAVAAMGFCYPGTAPRGGDLPPRPECAPRWRAPLLGLLRGVRLTLLIGGYAQRWRLGPRCGPVEALVRNWRDGPPDILCLPHPSWRNTAWLRRNPWFDQEFVPMLQARVAAALKDPE